MSNLNLIAGGIVILLCAIILGIKVYQNVKNKNVTSIDDFIDTYGDNIISILEDAIKILRINMSDFTTKEDYEKAIIETSIKTLKENSIQFGIPENIINLIDTDSLTDIIQNVLNNNKLTVFSVLDFTDIDNNKSILDTDVIEAFSVAKEVVDVAQPEETEEATNPSVENVATEETNVSSTTEEKSTN